MPKKVSIFLFCILIFLGVSGCTKTEVSETTTGAAYRIYYVNKASTKVVSMPYQLTTDLQTKDKKQIQEQLLKEFLEALQTDPDNPDYRRPIPSDVAVLEAHIESDKVFVTFDNTYLKMGKISEILNRAAVVRTLTQIEGIEYVSFQVNEQALMDSSGQPIGLMKASDFIDDLGGDISDYQRTILNLYFTNETGDKLIEETRELVYSNTISMERLVVEQLISGPATEGLYPVLPSDTKLMSISTKDGICYVNLDAAFLTSFVNTIEAIPIYAIVNSLVELPNVNKVQILINGETNKKYREVISLDTLFERNLDFIQYDMEE